MRTLERWVPRLLQVPHSIECPAMEVIGPDFEPALFTGSGQIVISSRTRIEFRMHASPRDGSEAFARIVRAQSKPHSARHQFRVLATEYDGTKWNCGYTYLHVGDVIGNVWHLSGLVSSLMTGVTGPWVARDKGVELVFDQKLRIPTPANMVTTTRMDDEEILVSRRRGKKVVRAAGTEVEFCHSAEGEDLVWVTAKTSSQFHHPFAENWISEPLQILLGQLVFPRLVARNQGNGTAAVWLRPSPPHTADVAVSSMLGDDSYAEPQRFWRLYANLLTMIAYARDEKGEPNFEAHPLTQYYREIAQSSTGSHWVLCMTLASAVEGITKLLVPKELRGSEFAEGAIEDLGRHIREWKGDPDLRGRILGSLKHAEEKGVAQFLKTLCKDGTLEIEHVSTWLSVRNQVMHGALVSPWLDEELEKRLRRLIDLTHRLSEAFVRKWVSDAAGSERPIE